MRAFASRILLLFLLLTPQVAFSDEDENGWYNDVPTNHVYRSGVYYMYQGNYVEGYEDGSFQPDEAVNRVEALKMIMQFADEDLEDSVTDTMEFPDLDDEAWYYEYVESAYALGIAQGHDDGYFKPEDTVNRAEALALLLRATGTDLERFDYSNEGEASWFTPYINFADENALLVLGEDNEYYPEATLTRGELCDIIYRFKKSPYTGEVEYGVASYYGYSFDGANTASGTPLEIYGHMAAHKTLPFGTVVKVTNIENNQSTTVTIVDRGPYIEGRIIDLTPTSFEDIAPLSSGITHVRMEIIAD